MNSILKASGLALIILASIVLIASYFVGWTNINAVQSGSLLTMIIGLIVYIIFGKRCLNEKK